MMKVAVIFVDPDKLHPNDLAKEGLTAEKLHGQIAEQMLLLREESGFEAVLHYTSDNHTMAVDEVTLFLASFQPDIILIGSAMRGASQLMKVGDDNAYIEAVYAAAPQAKVTYSSNPKDFVTAVRILA